MSSPIEQIKKEIAALETERETLYVKFKEIEASIQRKRRQVEVWTEIAEDPAMQAKLLEQMTASGLIENS